ncbi:MAG: lysophospholipid acyltransferase family protein [Eubacteriales bacterium]|nr:lysophospholipid acyltransferase family protein [Eubacteriales bacterium]
MNKEYSPKLYRILLGIASFLIRIIFPPKVEGLENLPQEGGCILCANHVCMIDPAIIASLCRRPVRFMGKNELFSTRFAWVTSLLYKVGAFPVSRGEADLSSIRTSLSLLKDEQCLLIFGQGTRRRKQDVQEPPLHTGAPRQRSCPYLSKRPIAPFAACAWPSASPWIFQTSAVRTASSSRA